MTTPEGNRQRVEIIAAIQKQTDYDLRLRTPRVFLSITAYHPVREGVWRTILRRLP